MSVELLKNERAALIVPEEALIPRGERNVVLLVDETKSPAVAEERTVAIGTRRVGEVEILEGLQPGDHSPRRLGRVLVRKSRSGPRMIRTNR